MKKLRPLLEDENVQARLVVAAFFILLHSPAYSLCKQ